MADYESHVRQFMYAIRNPSPDPIYERRPCAHCGASMATRVQATVIEPFGVMRNVWTRLGPGCFAFCVQCCSLNQRTVDGWQKSSLDVMDPLYRRSIEPSLRQLREAHKRLREAN